MFPIYLILSGHWALEFTQPLTEINTKERSDVSYLAVMADSYCLTLHLVRSYRSGISYLAVMADSYCPTLHLVRSYRSGVSYLAVMVDIYCRMLQTVRSYQSGVSYLAVMADSYCCNTTRRGLYAHSLDLCLPCVCLSVFLCIQKVFIFLRWLDAVTSAD
jgi:hypothetical protein